MNTYTIPLIGFLVLACNSTNNKTPNTIKTAPNIVTEQSHSVIFDTLVFNENINNELLIEKFNYAKTKLEFYKKFIINKKINILETINDQHTKTEIIYLGELRDLNKTDSYHVITNFKIHGIGKMPSPRGRSEVSFIHTKNNQILIYDLGIPGNLPKKIEGNILYFEIKGTEVGISIYGGLAPELCIPIIGCN